MSLGLLLYATIGTHGVRPLVHMAKARDVDGMVARPRGHLHPLAWKEYEIILHQGSYVLGFT